MSSNAWYHWYAVWITSTGAADFMFSSEYPTPALPGAISKYRYIASWSTKNAADTSGASTNWAPITQYGDEFFFNYVSTDCATNVPASFITTADFGIAQSLRLPPGPKIKAYLQAYWLDTSGSNESFARVFDPAMSDQFLDSTPIANIGAVVPGATNPPRIAAPLQVWASTTGAVRVNGTRAGVINLATIGFYNQRGRNSPT
jgi:hypothetical protein